jgi:anti-sigma factor RsiW
MDGIREHELERIDAWLDGELSAAEAESLQRRIGEDPALAAALAEGRSGRDLRRTAWEAQEASISPEAAHAVGDRIIEILNRRNRYARRKSRLVRAGALAACLILGVGVGWVGRPWLASPPRTASAPSATPVVYQVLLTDADGHTLVQPFDSAAKARAFAADLQQWQAYQHGLGRARLITIADRY